MRAYRSLYGESIVLDRVSVMRPTPWPCSPVRLFACNARDEIPRLVCWYVQLTKIVSWPPSVMRLPFFC